MNPAVRTEPAPDNDPARTARILRRHLAGHNLRVALLAVVTLVASAVLWALLYAVSYWLTLLLFTVIQGANVPVPAGFRPLFATAALGLLFVAWVDRRLTPDDRPRDSRTVGEIVLEFVLAIPRITFSIIGTLSAWQRLQPAELQLAALLVERLAQERRIRVQSLPVDIPDPAACSRILFALQVTQIIDTRREGRDLWLQLSPLRPQALRRI